MDRGEPRSKSKLGLERGLSRANAGAPLPSLTTELTGRRKEVLCSDLYMHKGAWVCFAHDDQSIKQM